MTRIKHLTIILAAIASIGWSIGYTQQSPKAPATFHNPLLPDGPDPWALFQDGNYYYMNTKGSRLDLWKTKDITDLKNAQHKTIWLPTDPSNSKNLWAPEIHYINKKWYVYYAADNGNTDNHQIYVLENDSKDPFEGTFVMKGRVSTDPDNNWAIDASVIEHKKKLYMVWSGWQTRRVDTETQCIYIAEMANPWTLSSKRVLLSKPELDWERIWKNETGWTPPHIIYVNEGPQPLFNPKRNKLFIVYSASGCWTPYYTLGMLSIDANKNPLNPANWKKSQEPIFKQSPENKVFGPGHNSFFQSPDAKETWIIYHARDTKNDTSPRSPRAQKIAWDAKGMPVLGKPASNDSALNKPSGTITSAQ